VGGIGLGNVKIDKKSENYTNIFKMLKRKNFDGWVEWRGVEGS
jgi:hypothetical protein